MTAAFSQETQTTNSAEISAPTAPAQSGADRTNAGDVCDQRLLKALDAYEKLKTAAASVDAENKTNIDLRAKEEAFNAELLKAITLLVSSEKRNKSFFKKLELQLGVIIKNATDAKTLATVATLIIILKNLK